ncbi:MAG: ATP-dependent Clp protease proteolytic subunit [Blastocatellia bacterium]
MTAKTISKARVKLKKPPVLFSRTQRLVRAVAEKTGGLFLCYWHSGGSVCQNDVQALYEVLEKIGPQKKLYIFIKSGGGEATASLRIVNLLRRYADHIVTLLPLECASAATMIALGSNEIKMGPLAYLTAVDTSLTHDLSPVDIHNRLVSVSQDELNRVVGLWRKAAGGNPKSAPADAPNAYSALFPHVHPLVIGALDRSSSLSVMLCREILGFHMRDEAVAERISVQLNSAYPAHSYPILQKEARRIGLNVGDLDPELNQMLLDLNQLYSEMGQEAITDYDEQNYHNNEILDIVESVGIQLYYQQDKDWHYRTEERRWVPLNDNSSWRKIEKAGTKTVQSVFHIR